MFNYWKYEENTDKIEKCFGACDIIVVEDENGKLDSTPFILNTLGAIPNSRIKLEVNGVISEVVMYVNKNMYGEFREDLSKQKSNMIKDYDEKNSLISILRPQINIAYFDLEWDDNLSQEDKNKIFNKNTLIDDDYYNKTIDDIVKNIENFIVYYNDQYFTGEDAINQILTFVNINKFQDLNDESLNDRLSLE